MIIENRKRLVSHGNRRGKGIALDIAEHGIAAVNAYVATTQSVQIRNGQLIVGDLTYELSRVKDTYVIGGGKATFPIAQALDEILGDRIKRGCIIVKRGEKRKLKHVKVIEAGHPIPDKMGLRGAEEIVSIANDAKKGDLFSAQLPVELQP